MNMLSPGKRCRLHKALWLKYGSTTWVLIIPARWPWPIGVWTGMPKSAAAATTILAPPLDWSSLWLPTVGGVLRGTRFTVQGRLCGHTLIRLCQLWHAHGG